MPKVKHSASNPCMLDASKEGDIKRIRSLTKKGADVNVTDTDENDGNTALIYAARNADDKCLQVLLKAGASVNKRNKCGETALMYAAENRRSTCVELLLQAGAHQNARHKYPTNLHKTGPTGSGYTALMRAAFKGRVKCVDALLKAGAKVEIADITNGSALYFAVWKRHPKCVDLLIKAGADVNKIVNRRKSIMGNYSPLYKAAQNDDRRCFDLLIQAGAHVNTVTIEGKTALFEAVRHNNIPHAKALIQAGADVNRVLIASVERYNPRHVKILLEVGAGVNLRDENGNSLLYTPFSNFWPTPPYEVFMQLLQNGIYVNQLNNSGRNAAQEIKEQGINPREKVARLLLAAGEKLDGCLLCNKYTIFSHVHVTQARPELLLMDITRVAIRNHLVELDPPLNLFIKVPQLGLPSLLVNYLLYGLLQDLDEN